MILYRKSSELYVLESIFGIYSSFYYYGIDHLLINVIPFILNWEIDITEAIRNTDFSLICIYNFYDFINHKVYIDRNVIERSLKTHSHLLSKSNFIIKSHI